ncbi:MAG: outer membrane beta-barrel protein [Hyphomicrobium sp.]|nr:outer membrane beta-barrel protein [Hyphomicrobium sp.]
MRIWAGLAGFVCLSLSATDAAQAERWSNRHDRLDSCCASDFTGIYAGISIGYAHAGSEVTNEIIAPPVYIFTRDDIGADDVIGSVSLGYDRQIGSAFVLGVFGDYSFGDLSSNLSLTAASNLDLEVSNMWAVGGRIGVLVTDAMMVYANAGYTEADLDFEGADFDLDGYFVGGGIEQALGRGFFMKLEYRYADYGSTRLFESSSLCCSETLNTDTDVHSFRVGINYKFGRRDEAATPLK